MVAVPCHEKTLPQQPSSRLLPQQCWLFRPPARLPAPAAPGHDPLPARASAGAGVLCRRMRAGQRAGKSRQTGRRQAGAVRGPDSGPQPQARGGSAVPAGRRPGPGRDHVLCRRRARLRAGQPQPRHRARRPARHRKIPSAQLPVRRAADVGCQRPGNRAHHGRVPRQAGEGPRPCAVHHQRRGARPGRRARGTGLCAASASTAVPMARGWRNTTRDAFRSARAR